MSEMRAEIISIGTELLLGEVVDTNAAFIADQLAQAGINLYYKTTVGDNWLRLNSALSIALSRANLLIVTGGLGPTQDDITKDVIAGAVGHSLTLHNDALQHIQHYLQMSGRPMTETSRRQAMFPEGADMIPNPNGSAPGVWLETNDRIIISLPGVPHEMRAMMQETVVPRLTEKQQIAPLHSKVLRFLGIGESALEREVIDIIEQQSTPTLAIYASLSDVRLRMTCRAETAEEAEALFAPLEEEIRKRVGKYLYAMGEESLEQTIGKSLIEHNKTLAVAESCSGGLLGHQLTTVAGSSQYFMGGIVAYDNEVKEQLLSVPSDMIERHGAVSEQVAYAMADGVRQRLDTDFGIGITGIAGPDGGTDEKPVGTVYVACTSPSVRQVVHRVFKGKREVVKERSAREALRLLFQCVQKSST